MRSINELKLVAEPTRLRILNLLIEQEICVCELQEILDLPQVSVSKHLMKLRENKFVKTNKKANRVFYSLNEEVINECWLEELIRQLRINEKALKDDYDLLAKHNNVSNQEDYHCPKS